ncbi:MAG TPA: hypothetical protein VGG48_11650 [Rhizomicrobium sp.]
MSQSEKIFSVLAPLVLALWFGWKLLSAVQTGEARFFERLIGRDAQPARFWRWVTGFAIGCGALLGLMAYNLRNALL